MDEVSFLTLPPSPPAYWQARGEGKGEGKIKIFFTTI